MLSLSIRRNGVQNFNTVFACQRQTGARHFSRSYKSKALYVKYLLIPGGAAIGIGGVVYTIDKYAYSSLLTRSVRALYVLLWIAYAYSNTDKYDNLNDLHEVAAESLLQMFTTNKGLYIKLGQGIANQGSIFPMAFQKRFPQLYDSAPQEPWSNVEKMLKKNLGQDYETEVFEYISHQPIASASIAQVHKAKLKNGTEVAVKIQHGYIEKQIIVDLSIHHLMTKVFSKVFDLPLTMFTKYIADQIAKETNFITEMANSERLKKYIAEDSSMRSSNVYVPKNYRATEQVLITEWIDGHSLSDKEVLLNAGLDLGVIMKQYLGVFGKQIFKYGWIHSDPHPGNLMARFDSRGKQQLVILDHGLYVELPEEFRLEYCNLWRYLFLVNSKGILEIAKEWGIGSPDIFASFVQLRPVLLDNRTNDIEKDSRGFHNVFQELIGDESKFPLELMFLGRTMRMIQNLNQSFGSPVNRINLLTKELIDALVYEKPNSLVNYIELLTIKATLFVSDILFYFLRFKQILSGDRYGGKGKGLEDYLEKYMQNTAKSMGIEMA